MPVDARRRDFPDDFEGREQGLVEGDLADIDNCDAVLAAFTQPDEGTAMEAWYATPRQAGRRLHGRHTAHPWTNYVSTRVVHDLQAAVDALEEVLR